MSRIQARIGAERPYRSARRPRVRLFDFFFCHLHSSSRFSPLPSHTFSTRPPAQDNREQITFLPTLTAPDLPFSFLFVFRFLCTLGNDNRPLATAARHQYAPEHSSIDFSSFLLTFLLLLSCTFGTMTTRLPTHPRHRSFYHRIRLQTVGTQMYSSKHPR